MTAGDENSGLDDIIDQLGQFGKIQMRTYFWIALPVILAGNYNSNYVFTAKDINYRCKVPQCDGNSSILETDWLSLAMPNSNDSRRCTMYAPSNITSSDPDVCSADIFDKTNVVPCEEWVYGEGESVVKDLGIQCQSWKRTLIGTLHSCGLLLALPIVGFISDKYGRRTALALSAFFAGIFGLLRSFSTSYLMFVSFELIEPTFGSGVYSSAFILGMELVGPKRRVLGGTLLCMFYSLGAVMLGGLAWALPHWRMLLRVIYAPSLIFIIYFWIIHESVRWLLSKGRYDKAVEILKHAAKVNGATLSDKSMEHLYANQKTELNEIKTSSEEECKAPPEPSVMGQVIRSPIILRRVIKCSFWWITCTFVYYGLSINSVSLAGNIYLNYILVSCVELPAYCTSFMLLDRLGRKYTLSLAYFGGGIACIAFPFLPAGAKTLSVLMYLFGKYFITMAFASLYIYTSELFPTNARHSLLACCSMVGRIGAIVAPQTPLLAEYFPMLPPLLFGGFSIVSGLLILTSPETLNIKLPDTIKEAERISSKSNKDPEI